jgi:glycosyltransferase involved in cell wall biosynthesis
VPHSTKVSVVIPCYNHGAFVAEAIASVSVQTWTNLETIVVDDGSDDDMTRQAIASLEHDPRVRVVRIPHGGPAAARNAGIDAAAGPYVFTLDADDRIAPTLIEKAVGIADADAHVGIVYCEAQFFGARTGVWELQPYRFPDILLGNVIPSAGLFRRADWERVNGYNPNMTDGWEDYDFWLSLIALGRRVVQIPEPLLEYRRCETSRSTGLSRDAVIRSHAQIFRNHLDLYAAHIDTVITHIVDLRTRVARLEAEAAARARLHASEAAR